MLKLAKPHRNRAGSAFLLGQIAFSQGLPCRWIKDRRLMRFIVVDCAGSAEALWNLPFAWEAGCDPPPLNGSTLKYGFDHEGGPQWRTSVTSPTRSSRGFGSVRFCAAKAWRWRMLFARSAFPRSRSTGGVSNMAA